MLQQIKHKVCYRLVENSSLDSWLADLDLTVSTSASEEYFDDSDCSFSKKSIFIKLKNNSLLEIKSNTTHLTEVQATHAIRCRTYSFPLRKHMFDPKQLVEFNELEAIIGIKRPPPFSFSHFLGCNKLRTLATLNKTQKTYKNSTFPRILIVVEAIDQLGTFVKIEGCNITIPYPIDDFLADVRQLVQNLPLLPCDSDYVMLALRETNENLHSHFQEQKS